jgi:hypothetical protein
MDQVCLWDLCVGMGFLIGGFGSAPSGEAEGGETRVRGGGSSAGMRLCYSLGDDIIDPVTGHLDRLPKRAGSLQLEWIDGRRRLCSITLAACQETR